MYFFFDLMNEQVVLVMNENLEICLYFMERFLVGLERFLADLALGFNKQSGSTKYIYSQFTHNYTIFALI